MAPAPTRRAADAKPRRASRTGAGASASASANATSDSAPGPGPRAHAGRGPGADDEAGAAEQLARARFSTSVAAALNLFGPAQYLHPPPILPKGAALTPAAIRRALPPRLFERSALRSLFHVAKDLVVVAVLGAAATRIEGAPAPLRAALWVLYWCAQGSVMTGLWVLAHECGHQSFSASRALNDSVGWVLHSALLVPYHSWRISHANHHSNTCSMENDEVFVPSTRSEYLHAVEDTPLWNAVGLLKMLLFGWPFYLAANFAGPAKYVGKANSHFNPSSALYALEPNSFRDVLVSDVGFFCALAALAAACQAFSAGAVIFYYGVPYLVVNLLLVLITYLQHTDSFVPHYRAREFTWLRGALSTVDRSFGWLLDDVLHHISDTHVVHHLFSTMPFYHCQEATEIVRAKLGEHYLRDDTPIPYALWRAYRRARFVEDEGEILFMKDAAALNAGFEKQLRK